jgi:hypothetical protein
VNARLGPGNPLAKVLEESGFVNRREIADSARVKVERILADVLSRDSGSFEFEDGVLPKGAVDLKIPMERLLLAATQRIADRGFALRHIDLTAVLEAAPEGEASLSEVRAEVWPLLERLDGQRTLKDAIALTRLDEFEAAKTACAMLFLGIVRRTARGQEVDLAEEAQSGFAAAPPIPEPEPTGVAFTEAEAAGVPAGGTRAATTISAAGAGPSGGCTGALPESSRRGCRNPEAPSFDRAPGAKADRHGARRPARPRAARPHAVRPTGRAFDPGDRPVPEPGGAPDPGGPRGARRPAQPRCLRPARPEPGREAASREVGAAVPSADDRARLRRAPPRRRRRACLSSRSVSRRHHRRSPPGTSSCARPPRAFPDACSTDPAPPR